ncbi:hypothetical protein [Roseomonas fluvialis]|uniref:Twin-arginine translocation pathway signal protein n=1 Tax=Roseomonas fluvialis TaxID=1750527 RepID=A0ABM7Y821_9PROT|nr:hypothetical protein [Roseomonas fluvialis]BDG74136.1 hypothetical protein Rmf_40650 [Roseomonas fluvialis]
MSTRRILLAGAAGAFLALQGRTLRAASADPVAPWAAAPAAAHPDWRVRAAFWAVLAPNPHNRQPWILDLQADGSALLRCDLDRRLPATDPFDRQITIGLGCFAELFRMAAAQQGQALRIEALPEGEPGPRLDARPIARFVPLPGAATPDPLFAHAPARRSAKVPFDTARTVTQAQMATLAAATGGGFGGTTDSARVAALRDLTWRAWVIEAETPAAHMETINLMRLGSPAIAAQPDGISVGGPGLDDLIARGVLTREGFATPGAPGYREMFNRYRPMLAATTAHVWLNGAATRTAALAAGAEWLRLNLAATGLGLALHPVSQALQEYPEMAGPFAEAQALMPGPAGSRVHMMGRIGHLPDGARAPRPTPRWPAESRILGA